jgi:hypothetical protein
LDSQRDEALRLLREVVGNPRLAITADSQKWARVLGAPSVPLPDGTIYVN